MKPWYNSILNKKNTVFKGIDKINESNNNFILNKNINQIGFLSLKQDMFSYNSYGFFNKNFPWLDNYISTLLTHYFEASSVVHCLISKPIFKHSSNKVEILFYSYNNNNNNNSDNGVLQLKNLTNLISKVYNKPTIIRRIELKYPQLNVEIFAKYISILASCEKRNFLSFYNKISSKFRIFGANPLNYNFNSLKTKDNFNVLLDWSQLVNYFISCLPFAFNSGLKIELKGRYSKRRSASRTSQLTRTKGSFKNFYAASKGMKILPHPSGRNSNLQVTQVLSKTRNGSYNFKFTIANH